MNGITVEELEPRDALDHVEIVKTKFGFRFAMLDCSHYDAVDYLTRTDCENAAINYIVQCRPELFGTGELKL